MVYLVLSCSYILFCTHFILISFVIRGVSYRISVFEMFATQKREYIWIWPYWYPQYSRKLSFTGTSCARIPSVVNRQQLCLFFLWSGLHYRQFIPWPFLKLIKQQQQCCSSTERYTCSFRSHFPWVFEREFAMTIDRKRRANCVTPSFSWSYAFGLFFCFEFYGRSGVELKTEYNILTQNTDHCSNCRCYIGNVTVCLARGGL
jgi:hypothetical protein